MYKAKEILEAMPNASRIDLMYDDYHDNGDCRVFEASEPPGHWEQECPSTLQSNTFLCNVCRASFNYMIQYLSPQENRSEIEGRKPPAAVIHHPNLQSLEESVEERCHLCVQLSKCSDRIQLLSLPEELGKETRIELCWPSELVEEESEHVLGSLRLHFTIVNTQHERASEFQLEFLRLQLWPAQHCAEIFQAHHLFDKNNIVFGRSVDSLTPGKDLSESWVKSYNDSVDFVHKHQEMDNPTSRSLVRRWLSSCQKNEDGSHRDCNLGVGDWLPPRLLNVHEAATTGKLRIVSPKQSPELFVDDKRYITVSHRWGDWGAISAPQLTQDNYAELFQSGIAVEELPETFSDALNICGWFGGMTLNSVRIYWQPRLT